MSLIPLLSVTSMQISVFTSDPPQIAINVQGFAGTPGWSDVQIGVDEGDLSADGILDLALIGTPPAGIVPQVVNPVSASIIWTEEAERVIGVRVTSRTDSLFRFIKSAPPPMGQEPELISELKGRPLRVIRPGGIVTTDFIPDRVNIMVDDRERIQSVTFG